MKHLTENQLQAHLDRGESPNNSHLEAHLSACEACRERLDTYQRLYAGLRQDRGYELRPGFGEAVMARLAAMAPAPAPNRSWERWLAGSGVVAAVCLVGYFVDLGSLMAILARPFAPMAQTSQAWLTEARGTLASFSGYTGPLSLSGTILLTVVAAEKLLWVLRDKRLFCL